MIRLTRNYNLAEIDPVFQGPGREAECVRLMEDQRRIRRGEIDKHPFRSAVWKKAKGLLQLDSRGKCSYCEAPTTLVAFGDVEHYRPKSVYWWLAYNYDNYLLSCQLCNQAFKGDRFPVLNEPMKGPNIRSNTSDQFIHERRGLLGPDPGDLTQRNEFIAAHFEERPLLLNPFLDDPEAFYAWQVDSTVREVTLIPAEGVPLSAECVDAAIEFYGLNRLELCQARYQRYAFYAIFRAIRDGDGTEADRDRASEAIDLMTAPAEQFAGMIRYFESFNTLP